MESGGLLMNYDAKRIANVSLLEAKIAVLEKISRKLEKEMNTRGFNYTTMSPANGQIINPTIKEYSNIAHKLSGMIANYNKLVQELPKQKDVSDDERTLGSLFGNKPLTMEK